MARHNLWTAATLYEHLTELANERDRRYQQRFEDQAIAINKAEEAVERRFESVNEFRAALSDQTATFLPRAEYESAHRRLVEQVSELSARIDRGEGRSRGLGLGWTYLVGFAGLILTIATLVGLLVNLRP